ncbi:DUF2255 family protein [Salana multivorans]
MSDWTPAELSTIDTEDELEIASYRADGTLRPSVTIWVVRVDDAVYVRSAYGPEGRWYRHALAGGTGRIRCGDVERDVVVTDGGEAPHQRLDAAYHRKYDRFGGRYVNPVVGPDSHRVTLRIDPR